MTAPVDLDAIEKRLVEATPTDTTHDATCCCDPCSADYSRVNRGRRALIAHAPTDIRDLVDEVRRLRGIVENVASTVHPFDYMAAVNTPKFVIEARRYIDEKATEK